jgi:hypothetical protein
MTVDLAYVPWLLRSVVRDEQELPQYNVSAKDLKESYEMAIEKLAGPRGSLWCAPS